MKRKIRLIAKLEVKGEYVVKGIRMEGLRKISPPWELCNKYFNDGIDELLFVDIVASLYGRNHLSTLVSMTAEKVFIPLIVGGGVRSIDDFHGLLRSGADKISLNTEAIKNPKIISEAAKVFGSQCVIVSIQAKKQKNATWEAYTENGRERTGVNALKWAKEVESLGAGEILLTSIDKDGTKYGFDVDLVKEVSNSVSIPVIASGGAASSDDIVDLVLKTKVNAVAIAHLLHFNIQSVNDIKKRLLENNIEVRYNKQA